MSVVQRCPSCGTTQDTPGECDACHEAQVRHFCTNHDPGLWLEGETCPTCDARRAEAARPAPRPAPRLAPRADNARARAPRLAPRAPWPEVFRGPGLARYTSAEASGGEAMPVGRALGGCLVRLVIITVVLAVALVAAVYFLGRALV